MINVSRLAALAALAAAVVACSSAPADEAVSVDVDTNQVAPNCVKGGISCGVSGTVVRPPIINPPGFVLDPIQPTPPPPEESVAPTDCGDSGCRWNVKRTACECGGAGYGLFSTVNCSSNYSFPCPRSVLGEVRCYKAEPNGTCR
ncbi:MAG: hypothetical protein KF819_15880 [Labilithrix sp.]|nr:hypothetical protein [Labilithrix sp.]